MNKQMGPYQASLKRREPGVTHPDEQEKLEGLSLERMASEVALIDRERLAYASLGRTACGVAHIQWRKELKRLWSGYQGLEVARIW